MPSGRVAGLVVYAAVAVVVEAVTQLWRAGEDLGVQVVAVLLKLDAVAVLVHLDGLAVDGVVELVVSIGITGDEQGAAEED
ncbi:MAG: hypothetical protein IPN01_04775 [Deltaproteobacteria bacterium]|nr:hypothetical protein [Deltaproteobacteria bacterium]